MILIYNKVLRRGKKLMMGILLLKKLLITVMERSRRRSDKFIMKMMKIQKKISMLRVEKKIALIVILMIQKVMMMTKIKNLTWKSTSNGNKNMDKK